MFHTKRVTKLANLMVLINFFTQLLKNRKDPDPVSPIVTDLNEFRTLLSRGFIFLSENQLCGLGTMYFICFVARSGHSHVCSNMFKNI
jgi:hypothetical protein